MGIALALLHLAILLAASNSTNRTNWKRSSVGSSTKTANRVKKKGRQRYSPSSTTAASKNRRLSKAGGQRPRQPQQQEEDAIVQPVIPSLTDPAGPFPTYFTCRHTYEETLVDEIARYAPKDSNIRASVSCPGLVYVEGFLSDQHESVHNNHHHLWDPVYALQSLPNCRVVKCPNSIKGLARAIAEIDDFAQLLAPAPRGSLAIHALVPGMCKGQKDPIWQRRAHLVTDAVAEMWKKQFAAARKAKMNDNEGTTNNDDDPTTLLLQILLLSPDVAAASLSICQSTNQQPQLRQCWWPNPHYPVGMAQVDITTQKMPSSAYRKLLEAFACGGRRPTNRDTVVDLGASPGGWTSALLLYCDDDDNNNPQNPSQEEPGGRRAGGGIRVLAVDRSSLDPKLMKDPRVTFIQGDAFTFEPADGGSVDWMISDIIAYPERIVELVDHWCGKALATSMIITIKFQGNTPSWYHMDQALQVARSHHYHARVKHFFNNKNEVTLMLVHQEAATLSPATTTRSLIPPFYKPVKSQGRTP